MARKTSYANVELEPLTEPKHVTIAVRDAPEPSEPKHVTLRVRDERGPTLKQAASPVMLYLHPAAAKALKRFALEQDTKVHTLLLEAVEDWFKAHGLREPVRVTSAKGS